MAKTEAEGVILLENFPEFSADKIEGSRILVNGQGEYEVGGIKISTLRVEESLVAVLEVDRVRVVIGSGKSIDKVHEKVEAADILVVEAEGEFNESTLSTLEPKVLVVYGSRKEEVAKSLGKTEVANVTKYSAAADKLPEELQFILLG